MIQLLNHKYFRYIVLLPMIYLIGYGIFIRQSLEETNDLFVRQKREEMVRTINMLNETVSSAHSTMYAREHIVYAVETLDTLRESFAAAYELNYGIPSVISKRSIDTEFNPFNFDEFRVLVEEHEVGEFEVSYVPPGMPERHMYVYFRWMPMNMIEDSRFLVVAAVSEYSMTGDLPPNMSIAIWVNYAISFIMTTIVVILLLALGDIYSSRKHGKWHSDKDA